LLIFECTCTFIHVHCNCVDP